MDNKDEDKETYEVLGEVRNLSEEKEEALDSFASEPEESHTYFRHFLREKVHRPSVSLDFIKSIKKKLDY
jgi:ElaB/YqjD/DUF883 family membrane-anchored ribosome-binding protein